MLRILQIGVGGFGRAWREGIRALPDAAVVGLVDIHRDALEEAADYFGLTAERCFLADDPWERVDADLLLDSTPYFAHLANARRAYPTGKHHLVVRPMADSWSAGLEMVELAEMHGIRLVVGQQMRYHPLIEKLRELVRDGEIGTPTQLLLDFVGPIEGFTHRAWRQPHPLLIESAFQHVDCIRYVLGADATTVVCEAWTPNYLPQEMTLCAVATYRMENNARVCYRGISSNDVSLQTSWLGRWMLEGDRGVLRVVKDTLTLNGDEMPTTSASDRPASDLDFAAMNARVLRDTALYLRTGVEPGVSGRNCLNSLSMVTGAVESSESGARVALYRRATAV
jgi:predicted dehydrogenase